MWRWSSCQVWYAKAWKMWPQTLIYKIIFIGSSTYIYNILTNENINYLKSKSGKKGVTHVNFFHMQKFLSQVSNTSNTFNVLLTPHASNIVVHFNLINYFFYFTHTRWNMATSCPFILKIFSLFLCLDRL
jgi:hypothetical protein